jgi:hypothetical protein
MRGYLMVYGFMLLVEMIYVLAIWTPYGRVDGNMRPWYQFIRRHLDVFVMTSIIVLVLYNLYFPGLGIWALTITLYRVAQMCCGPESREGFGDGLPYGWGTFHRDNATLLDPGLLEREQDNTRAAYSSALGDDEDRYWMSKLAELENNTWHRPISKVRRTVAIFPKDSCGWDNWVIPKLREVSFTPGKEVKSGMCGCEPCALSVAGSLFETRVQPRPLYTTSLLAKEMNEA